MKKNIKSIFIILLIIATVLTGCKIERPDDVAEDTTCSTNIGIVLNDGALSEDTSDVKSEDEEDKEEADESNEVDEDKIEENESNVAEGETNKEKAPKDNKDKDSNKVANKIKDDIKKPVKEKSKEELLVEANKHRESGTKDQYLTDPTPEGMPKPKEWQNSKIDKSKVKYCTLSVDCLTILDNMKDFNNDKMAVLPKDGIIYKDRRVMFYEGESVFNMLNREMKKNRIHMEFTMTPIYNSNYIEGIHNLYEFDCGRYSGWMYKVNGWYPNYGCSRYVLKDGDVVNWRYTCDLGRDVGCTWMGETLDD